jgi:ABC-2 type transport system ATP-binding protein
MAERRTGSSDPGTAREPAVAVRELTRRFGDFTAVDAVSFDVAAGEIFGFLGPNGAGKTTTIKMLAGLLRPSAGTARIAGHDVLASPARVKRSIGYMSQLFSLYPDLTVAENIRLFGGLYDVTGERFAARRDWVLEMAGLERQRDRLTAELPLGWKQRLALGCAVLHEPPILFLDEPTSGVDPVSRRNFWDLIYGFAGAGTAVLVSTHYMEEAEYCHRLAVMNRGRLVALGRPAELKARIEQPILEVVTDDPPAAVDALQGHAGIAEVTMFGRKLHVMIARDAATAGDDGEAGGDTLHDAAGIRRELEAAGRRVESIAPIPPALEDAFVAFVQGAAGQVDG